MPKSTLAGHPLHPQLISAPAGLMPMSLVLDAMNAATGKEPYADAAYYTMVGGLVGGLGAAVAGAADYLTIPAGTRTKRLGNTHALLNVSVMGLTGVNVLMRRSPGGRSARLPKVLNLVGNLGLLASAWYGGEMVYDEGMRVRGVSPVADAPSAQIPGDGRLASTFDRAANTVPGGGPTS